MPTTRVPATGEIDLDALLSGTKWLDGATFSFPDAPADYGGQDFEAADRFAQVSVRQQQMLRWFLDSADPMLPNLGKTMSVADFTNFRGVYTGFDTSDIRIGQSGGVYPAYADYPADGRGGDIWFGTAFAGTVNDWRDPVLGGYAYYSNMHEALHALGLKHAQEAGGVAGTTVSPERDSIEYSVTSYLSYVGQTDWQSGLKTGDWDAPQTAMMLDIQALQHLYGANYGYHAGDTTYRWSPTTGELSIDGAGQGQPGANRVFMTLWDGGGIDTYDVSNHATGVKVDLSPGGWSTFDPRQLANLNAWNVASQGAAPVYAAGCVANSLLFEGNTASLIENAVCGSGNDTLVGNQADNLLAGGAGDDHFWASAGNDAVIGGDGIDTLHLGGAFGQYRIAALPGGGRGFSLLDLRGQEGSGTVQGVEWFAFADRTLAAADLLPRASVAAAQGRLAEGSGGGATAFAFTVSLSAASDTAQTVEYRVSGSGTNPADAADFFGGASPSGVIAFAAGETTKTITVGMAADTVPEADETFTLALVNPSAGLLIGAGSASATIANDDSPPRSFVSLSAVSSELPETGPGFSAAFFFRATLNAPSQMAHTVHWAVSGTGANPADASDFWGGRLYSGDLTFAPGETSKTFDVLVAGDAAYEPDETFAVALSNPSPGLVIETGSATAAIRSDDAAPVLTTAVDLSIGSPGKFEGSGGGTTVYAFTARLDRAATTQQTVEWAVAGGSLSPTDTADFSGATSGTLVFAAGETSKAIGVQVRGDNTREADETFVVSLSDPSTGLKTGQSWALATVLNDDTVPAPMHVSEAQIAAYHAMADRMMPSVIKAHGGVEAFEQRFGIGSAHDWI